MNSCAHWLNWKCGINLGAAREKVRVAHALCELNWYTDDDGSYVFRARLSPEQGARIAQALNAAMDTLHQEQRNAAEDVSAETPIAARRADALERIVDGYLCGGLSGGLSEGLTEGLSGEITREPDSGRGIVKGGDRCTLPVHTDMNTLQADGAESELASGGCVSAETSRRLACDCGVMHWLDNTDGTTLNIGRRTRSIPHAIRLYWSAATAVAVSPAAQRGITSMRTMLAIGRTAGKPGSIICCCCVAIIDWCITGAAVL